MPMANCLPEEDTVFLSNLDITARNILKQVRNHPIVEWTGGNEMSWQQGQNHKALHVLEKAVNEEDGRIFRTTCPILGSRHSPWHYVPNSHYVYYNNVHQDNRGGPHNLMRYGEFRCQTLANLEVWYREIPPASQWPIISDDDPVHIRKNVVRAVFGTDFWLLKKYINKLFGPTDDLEAMIKAGQFMGAEGLRYAMDALRRMGKSLGEFTSWDFNEPWANGAGSYMVDFDGRTLMNYDFIKQSLAPICLSLKYDSILFDKNEGIQLELYMTSDAPDMASGYGWEWVAKTGDVSEICHGKGEASIEPQQVLKLEDIRIEFKDIDAPVFVELRLFDGKGVTISERLHIFGEKGTDAPMGGLFHRKGSKPVGRADLCAVSYESVGSGEMTSCG